MRVRSQVRISGSVVTRSKICIAGGEVVATAEIGQQLAVSHRLDHVMCARADCWRRSAAGAVTFGCFQREAVGARDKGWACF